MEDRELLELAAKAAGYEIEESSVGGEKNLYREGELVPWNPLEDDGDALRLAGSLRMTITTAGALYGIGKPIAIAQIGGDRNVLHYSVYLESVDWNVALATRLAITGLAAEIGKGV